MGQVDGEGGMSGSMSRHVVLHYLCRYLLCSKQTVHSLKVHNISWNILHLIPASVASHTARRQRTPCYKRSFPVWSRQDILWSFCRAFSCCTCWFRNLPTFLWSPIAFRALNFIINYLSRRIRWNLAGNTSMFIHEALEDQICVREWLMFWLGTQWWRLWFRLWRVWSRFSLQVVPWPSRVGLGDAQCLKGKWVGSIAVFTWDYNLGCVSPDARSCRLKAVGNCGDHEDRHNMLE